MVALGKVKTVVLELNEALVARLIIWGPVFLKT